MTIPSVEEFLPPSALEFEAQLQRALKTCKSRRDKLAKCEESIYESVEGLEECQIQIEVARQIVHREKLYTETHKSLKRWEQSLRLDKKQLDCSQNHKDMIKRYSRQFYRRTNAWPWDIFMLVSQQQPKTWSRQLLEGLAKLADLQRDVDKISDSLQEAVQIRAGRGSKKRGLSKVGKLVPADIYTVIESMEQGIAIRDINVKGISKQQKKRKKDEEQNDTCAPNKRSKRGKGGNGIGSKPGKGPKGALAGGKGSKKGRPGQGKDPEEDTAADEGSDRENAGEEASEKESAAGDNINMDSAGGDGTRRASSDVENSADGANGGESGTDESDVEDIAGGSVGGTEDAVAGSTGEEDSIGEGMGGHDGNGLVGGQSAADRSVRAKDAAGGPNGEDDVADTGDGSTGVYDDPGRQDDIVTNSIEGDDATGGPTGRQDAKLAAAPLQDHDVNVADGWAARGADAADGPSAEVAARERTEGDDAKEGFEARGTGKDTRHGTIGQEETANGSTEGGELATDKIPGVQETAADYSDRTQDDTDVTTTQVEPLSTSIGAEDTAAQEAGQEDTAVAETARGQGDHIATKSAGGEVTIADQNAGKEDTAASGIAGEETTTPEEVVAADVLASLKTTGPLSGGNEVIVPQESPGLRLDVVNTEAGAQKNNGQRAMVEEAPENEADFSRTYQAAKPVDPPQTSGKKTPPQESPRTPRTRAAHARFPTMLPTPPQSDLRRILHQPKGMIAHPGSPKCLVDVPSDGEIDGESGEALAHQVSTYKAASHVSGDRMGTTSPDPLEKARNDTRKAIDEISTRLMKCEEIIAPPITSIPEIANGLRDIAAEMAGPYKRLRALKERAIMLHGQARR